MYVPKLSVGEASIDTEELGKKAHGELLALAKERLNEDEEIDETLDEESLMGLLLRDRLSAVGDSALVLAVRNHWADFDLYGGAGRISREEERAAYRRWLDSVRKGESASERHIPPKIRDALVGLLIAKGIRFERRAKVFREIHPLALQIILSSGVLNGILVVRSVDQCAKILGALIANDLDLHLREDADNYRLVEAATGSTVRVISRHELLRNAFDKQSEAEDEVAVE